MTMKTIAIHGSVQDSYSGAARSYLPYMLTTITMYNAIGSTKSTAKKIMY